MVDVVRCERPSVQAVPMPARQCIEKGCTRPSYCRGRCTACYQRFRRSDDFEPLPRSEYAPPGPAICLWCGPYDQAPSQSVPICPTCGLTPGEVRYTERILADSDAVWREENAAFQAARRKGQ